MIEQSEYWQPGSEPALVSDSDHFVDYCLWPYRPLTDTTNKWRSSNLLRHSFAVANMHMRVYRLCAAIQQAIGAGHTVWGVKWTDNWEQQGLSWEFYFYDYDRLERQVSISWLLKVLAPFIHCELQPNEQRPYFMFSIDIDNSWGEGELTRLDEISLYLGNTGCSVSSGISYGLTENSMAFNNLYYFFDAQQEFEQVVEKVLCSAHLDLANIQLEQILWPELTDCGVIVAANKRHNDGIYFSRIDLSQLLYGLKRLQCPPALVSFIEANSHRFDHMLYDLGFDYTMENGELKITKSAYYGVF